MKEKIIELTQKLLTSISQGDWETYVGLCDSSLTCFEPEARGHLVEGMDFHRFYFDQSSGEVGQPSQNTTISSPHVRMMGVNAAVISYVRLIQKFAPHSGHQTTQFEETRVWELQGDGWKHVHLHRSVPTLKPQNHWKKFRRPRHSPEDS